MNDHYFVLPRYSGIARPSGLGRHTYRWISAARLDEDHKKGYNFPSRTNFQQEYCTSKLCRICLIHYSDRKRAPLFFWSWVGTVSVPTQKLGGHVPIQTHPWLCHCQGISYKLENSYHAFQIHVHESQPVYPDPIHVAVIITDVHMHM